MKYILFLLPLYLFSFEVTMIDETKEGIKKAKENKIAKDGKVIYKPMEPNVIKPMKPKIIKSKKINIIYPIGSNSSVPIQAEENANKETPKDKTNPKESVFITKEALQKREKSSEKITLETFEKMKETNKTETISPVNIK